jgi:hypothetical protein
MSRARLFEVDIGVETNPREDDPQVVVSWTAFGGSGYVSSFTASGGVLESVVHIVNSFLPRDRAFTFPELSGEVEEHHLTRVPEPLTWVEGALMCHQKLVEMFEDDRELRLDMFALAYLAKDIVTARAVFDWFVEQGPETAGGDFGSHVDWDRDCLAPMRKLVAELEAR